MSHTTDDQKLAFGPVPSRRLGHSLGINNVPHKLCSYSCTYCQVGRTRAFRFEPEMMFAPEQISEAVHARVREARDSGERIDYLTFVADGEPTLDLSLGRTVELLRPLGIPLALISNASLVDRPDVREVLLGLDWVSLKVDAVSEKLWRKINRPHAKLRLASIHSGMLEFRRQFRGTLATETMLVRDLNDGAEEVRAIAEFLEELNPAVAYLSIPTRPPAEPGVQPPQETVIARAFQIFNARVRRTEYLIGYEGDAFAASGDPEADLLSITAVHPMREEAVRKLLRKTGAEWGLVQRMIADGRLVETQFQDRTYYMRTFGR
ncbi:MAG: radical SAM protein [Spirochaetales bacterium]|nr:radical SAM protein [Spirochaetales bacterium]